MADVSEATVMAIILDDHPLVCETIAAQVREQMPDVVIAYQGDKVADALASIDPSHTWIAIVDADLGNGQSADEVVGTLVNAGVAVALVSAQDNPVTVQRCLAVGALAYLPKRDLGSKLVGVGDALVNHRLFRSPELLAVLTPMPNSPLQLGPEIDRIMVLKSAGLPSMAIARRLDLDQETVAEVVEYVWDSYAAGRALPDPPV